MKNLLILILFALTSTLCFSKSYELWAWGINDHSQLGDGTDTNRNKPIQIGTSTDWKKIFCGGRHTMSINNDGTLWCWGENRYGQLGVGTYIASYSSPIQIGTSTYWKQIACGYMHNMGIMVDGKLWAWGYNSLGQLGDGTDTNRYSPIPIGTSTDWNQIACGYHYSLGIKSDGTLWAWGYNSLGQLGDGTDTNRYSPIQIGTSTDWKQIACGGNHTIGIMGDGTLWAWGDNRYGQLGDGTDTNRNKPIQIGTSTDWAQISCGKYYTIGIKSDGILWGWGDNTHGQLGDGTYTYKNSPTQIGTNTDWAQISCGNTHTLGIKSDGTLWAWGNNSFGQLGSGTTNVSYNSPINIGTSTDWKYIACGDVHTIALKGTSTSVEESIISENNISIFPNPATSQININYRIDNTCSPILKIYNIVGQIVYEKQLNIHYPDNYTKTIDLNNISDGIYILEITQDNTKSFNKITIIH